MESTIKYGKFHYTTDSKNGENLSFSIFVYKHKKIPAGKSTFPPLE